MRFIGITGGIGAGKSELLKYIRQHYKCEIYLADDVAHQVKEPGTDCYCRLLELLGESILDENKNIDKAAMAEQIFTDPAKLTCVNDIIHPAVKRFLADRLQEATQKAEVELFFVEAALLIENGFGSLVDEMWYIYADEAVRRKRLAESRGYSEEKIARIMGNQLSEEEFRKHCDFVIDNSGSLEESYRQIREKLEAYTWQE